MGDNTHSRAESDKEEADIWSGNEEEQDELHDGSYTAASRKGAPSVTPSPQTEKEKNLRAES